MNPMSKQEWQNIHKLINCWYGDFNSNLSFSKKGTKAAIRKDAEQKFISAIKKTKELIYRNPEAYRLLVGEENIGQASAEMFKDLSLPEYFISDISTFLNKIESRIQAFGEYV